MKTQIKSKKQVKKPTNLKTRKIPKDTLLDEVNRIAKYLSLYMADETTDMRYVTVENDKVISTLFGNYKDASEFASALLNDKNSEHVIDTLSWLDIEMADTFINAFKEILNWDLLSSRQHLTLDQIHKYCNYIDWSSLCGSCSFDEKDRAVNLQILTEDFLQEHIEYLKAKDYYDMGHYRISPILHLLMYKQLSEKFIIKNIEIISNWDEIAAMLEKQKLSDTFLNKFWDFDSGRYRYAICSNINITESFLKSHINKDSDVNLMYQALHLNISIKFQEELLEYLKNKGEDVSKIIKNIERDKEIKLEQKEKELKNQKIIDEIKKLCM